MKNYNKFLSFILILCIAVTLFSNISSAEQSNEYEKVKITQDGSWVIEKNRSNNPHGGSEWKLKSPKDQKEKKGKKRTATLDSAGKILRD